MSKTRLRVDEKRLVEEARDSVVGEKEMERATAVPGEKLPEGFKNQAPGERGHLCVDPEGRYQPDWTCLHIHRTSEDFPARQYFCLGTTVWKVRTGEWVDVPPGIMSILDYTIMEEIEMDISAANPIADKGVEKVVRRIPRFSTSQMPSA